MRRRMPLLKWNTAHLADTPLVAHRKFSANSFVRTIPKEELCECFLPAGACAHGVKTNNHAEIFNMMTLHVRQQKALFGGMGAFVHVRL